MLPDGTKIKAGGMVTYVPYSMGRMEYNWGPDAASFKPGRWFKDGVLKNESPFKFTAFQVYNLTYIFLLTLDFRFFYFLPSFQESNSGSFYWKREYVVNSLPCR